MLAEIEKLLAQVHTESGSDAAGQPSRQRSPPSTAHVHTGIGAIDSDLAHTPPTPARRVIELAGTAGSGKTQALLRICATAAMAPASADVVLIDADGTLDLRRLARQMRQMAVDGGATDSAAEAAAAQALQRVHVFQPATTHALVATLAMLPRYVRERRLRVRLVAIDALGGNHWIDRKEAACLQLKIKRATPWFRLQQLLVDTLLATCQRLDCLAAVAQVLVLPAFASEDERQERVFAVGGREFRDAMIPRWQAIVLRTYVLEPAVCPDGLTRVSFAMHGQPARHAAVIGPWGLRNCD
ncbi:hypothetical protein H4S01_007072 [Coemansia sp. RSA 2610]|nr:hypothetical protein H4S01_007072 [Coemansia sp. RSA 2610]